MTQSRGESRKSGHTKKCNYSIVGKNRSRFNHTQSGVENNFSEFVGSLSMDKLYVLKAKDEVKNNGLQLTITGLQNS